MENLKNITSVGPVNDINNNIIELDHNICIIDHHTLDTYTFKHIIIYRIFTVSPYNYPFIFTLFRHNDHILKKIFKLEYKRTSND